MMDDDDGKCGKGGVGKGRGGGSIDPQSRTHAVNMKKHETFGITTISSLFV